jgi:DNA-binding transcriptional MerR regulator
VRDRTKTRRLSELSLRRLESLGLLPSRGKGRSRVPAVYSDVDVLRASAVVVLRREGFTLAEIAVVLFAPPRTRKRVEG